MSSVNAFVAWAGSFALFTLAALVFGPFLLRLFGAATMLVPTVFLLSEANLNTPLTPAATSCSWPMAFIGLGLWVTGHRIHSAQHGWWKPPLAGTFVDGAGTRPDRERAHGRSRVYTKRAYQRPEARRHAESEQALDAPPVCYTPCL